MTRGAQFLLLASSVLVTGCAGAQDVKVRAIADPAAKLGSGAGLLGQARAQLALGNVGLALEGFRQLQREQPENAEVFAGLAACYSAMGRYDVARQNLEFALAYSPDNPALLTALASSLERLGEKEQAVQVQAEAARLSAPRPMARVAMQASPVTPLGVPRAGSVTVKLPEPAAVAAVRQPRPPAALQPRAKMQPAAVLRPEATIAPVQLANVTAKVDRLAMSDANVRSRELHPEAIETIAAAAEMPRAVPIVVDEGAAENARPAYLVASVSKVAAIEPVRALKTAGPAIPDYVPLRAAPEAPPLPEPPAPEKQLAVAAEIRKTTSEPLPPREMPVDSGPRLERTGLGEVALITVPRSIEKHVAARTLRAQPQPVLVSQPEPTAPVQQALATSSVRWLPLRYASAPQGIQLLNAARSDRLAAKARMTLRDEGLHNIAIGNARRARQSNLVLYSSAQTPVIRRLAAHFRCKALRVPGLKAVVVLLGRDAASQRSASARA